MTVKGQLHACRDSLMAGMRSASRGTPPNAKAETLIRACLDLVEHLVRQSLDVTTAEVETTLGVMEARDFKSIYGAGASFDGATIDSTAVLVKYTYYGDTDFNGTVDFDDYSRTDSGFNLGRTGWFNGDFDGNGVVDFDDYSLIDLAFNTQGSALRAARGKPAKSAKRAAPKKKAKALRKAA